MSWQPAHYLRFASQRFQPAVDLVTRLVRHPALLAGASSAPSSRTAASLRRVVDLGCGTGNCTLLLCSELPNVTRCVGVDSSAEMLAEAAASNAHFAPVLHADAGDAAAAQPRWVQAGLEDWPTPSDTAAYDVVFSNAALHWVGGHEVLVPRLLDALTPGGFLALQMPRQSPAPSHTAIRELLASEPYATRYASTLAYIVAQHAHVLEPQRYVEMLLPRCAAVDVWTTSYMQVLPARAKAAAAPADPTVGLHPVLDFVSSTTLVPVRGALSADDYAAFCAQLAARYRELYPARADGSVVFPFTRLFVLAQRAD